MTPKIQQALDNLKAAIAEEMLSKLTAGLSATRLPMPVAPPRIVKRSRYGTGTDSIKARAVAYVKAHPGCALASIAGALGANKATVSSVLQAAKAEGLVANVGERRNAVWYPVKP